MSVNISGALQMYLSGGTNAKIDLTHGSVATLYTTPSVATFNFSIINSILVSDDSGSGDTLTVTIVDTADSPATFSLFKTKAVGANATVEFLTNDLILRSGEILKVQAANANRLHVVASVLEFAQWR